MTALEVRRLSHPGHGRNALVAVGGVDGLALQISPSESKSWILRNLVGGRRRHIGLGSYPEVSLAQARERALQARELVRRGIDPISDRKAKRAQLAAGLNRALTFEAAMEQFLAAKLAEFRNEKHQRQWRSSLTTHALPGLGGMAVDQISVSDIRRVLEPIWTTKTETASRLRGRIEAVLAWATVAGHRDGDNPARWRGNLDAVLPKPSRVSKVVHHPAIQLDDAPLWFADLKARSGTATRALEFLVLTAARSGEVRGATWAEMDLNKALWVIPAERMKARQEHRVALGKGAVELLGKLPRLEGVSFVFPSSRGGMLSDASLSACMRRIHETASRGYFDSRSARPAVPHGLRSTFRDWAAEHTAYPREMVEIALAHSVGSDVERAYRRTDLLERRRQLMLDWAAFLSGVNADKSVANDAYLEGINAV